ncbi:MAG: hypothetical protein ACRDCY_17980 [Aeromonas veronii]
MIKQRYIRHQAINKQGEVVAIGYEVAKQVYPFGNDCKLAELHTESIAEFMATFQHDGSVQDWKRFATREGGPVRFTKAIVYVG